MKYNVYTKQILDVIASTIALIILIPAFIIISILIKLDSVGPIFYRQERIGLNGKLFNIYKFRTMTHNAECDSGPVWSTPMDNRVTDIGKFLRRSHLDELPQLLNVIFGEMSLVGPRPERLFFISKIVEYIPDYLIRTEVKPGITGLAQLKDTQELKLDVIKRKLKYDLFYMKKLSLMMDLRILWSTCIKAF